MDHINQEMEMDDGENLLLLHKVWWMSHILGWDISKSAGIFDTMSVEWVKI